MIDKSFWAGKRVFLTGHTGFKGSWLSLWLQQLGAEVFGYALEPAGPTCLYHTADVAAKMHSTYGDIADIAALAQAMERADPDIVLHLAAQPLVRESYIDPIYTFQTNVMGTANLLQSVRNCRNVRAVVVVTTDKVYQNQEWPWGYREHDVLGGHDPYSASKACTELVTAAFRVSFFQGGLPTCAIASVRAGNVIGGGDYAVDRLVPDILRSLQLQEPVMIRNPLAVRPWQHVLEPLAGYLLLAQRLYEQGAAYAAAWNFGPNDQDCRSVQWITERLITFWGQGTWQQVAEAQPHETQLLRVDSAKAKQRLNWQCLLTLEEALLRTVSWQRACLAGQDMYQYCLQDIQSYQTKLLENAGVIE